jgi:putative flippase GtrA
MPLTEDAGWFFDTELLVLAERAGLRIHEVPVDWIDDLDSRVDIVATAVADLRGIVRVSRGLARGTIAVPVLRAASLPASGPSGKLAAQILRFTMIGVLSTIAYVLLYLVFCGFLPVLAANAVAMGLTAIANTAANRRLTFGITGRAGSARHQLKGLIAFGIGLAMTSGGLALLRAASPHPGRLTEVAVLIGANLAATAIRFMLYRRWVFGGTTTKEPAYAQSQWPPVPSAPTQPLMTAQQEMTR